MTTNDGQDMRAMCDAYRAIRRRGGPDHSAFDAAVSTYMHRHPESDHGTAIAEASRLLDQAAQRFPHWLYGSDALKPW